MSEPTPKRPTRRAPRRQAKAPGTLPPIVCERCGGPVIRGIISTDGSPGPVDMSLADQLRQRAAMGGERERAELAAFEALLSECIANALVAQVRKEAEVHGVDVLTWLARDRSKDQT
jgi:hypothetical protein